MGIVAAACSHIGSQYGGRGGGGGGGAWWSEARDNVGVNSPWVLSNSTFKICGNNTGNGLTVVASVSTYVRLRCCACHVYVLASPP